MTRKTIGVALVLGALATCGGEEEPPKGSVLEAAAGSDPAESAEGIASTESIEAPGPAEDSPADIESQPTPAQYGPARDDLARFAGVYGDSAAQKLPRNFFVDRTCDGHLRFGAMWGDVAPWVMMPLSETEFEQAVLQPYETQPIRLEFHVDENGSAEGLTHTLGQESRIRRLGDLPEYFEDGECSG